MKGKTSSAKLLDKTIWNPRPVIDLLSRAVFESGVSFLHFLGPTLVRFWRFSALLTGAVGKIPVFYGETPVFSLVVLALFWT